MCAWVCARRAQVLVGLGDVCVLRKQGEARTLHPPKPGGRCMLLPDLVSRIAYRTAHHVMPHQHSRSGRML